MGLICCIIAALEKEVPEYKDDITADYQVKHEALVSTYTTYPTTVLLPSIYVIHDLV